MHQCKSNDRTDLIVLPMGGDAKLVSVAHILRTQCTTKAPPVLYVLIILYSSGDTTNKMQD